MCTVFCFARVARVYTCEYIEIFPGAKLVILVRAIYLFDQSKIPPQGFNILTYLRTTTRSFFYFRTYLVMCRVQPKFGLGLGPVESG